MPTAKEAPLSAKDLPPSAAQVKDNQPEGLLSLYLGKRYEPEELRNTERYYIEHEEYFEPEPQKLFGWQIILNSIRRRRTNHPSVPHDPYLPWIRAFPVPILICAQFLIHNDEELPDAIGKLLIEKFPNTVWDTSDVSLGVFRKYLFIHECLPAPEDTSTGQAMSLELFGYLISIDGMSLNSEMRHQLLDQYFRSGGRQSIKGEMILEICTATYANIWSTGIGVPMYL